MSAETLDQVLSAFPQDITPILSPLGETSIATLRTQAINLAEGSDIMPGSRLALCGLSPVELIIAIIAFDGKIEGMLLLPYSLDRDTENYLIEAAGCTHRLDASRNGLLAVNSSLPSCGKEKTPTRWILATSGTTGAPKLIEHTLATLSRTVKRDYTRGTNFVWGLLYDPCRFAGMQVVLQALCSCSKLIVSGSLDFSEQIDNLINNKVNALSATPSLWRKLLLDGKIKSLSLRQITLGGEIADQNILDALKYHFPSARIVHIYASTEAGSAFSVHDGLSGFPVNWLESNTAPVSMRIREDGHLLIKPTLLPRGTEIGNRTDADGYLDTEDLVQIDGDRVIFLGRASGAINVGGNSIEICIGYCHDWRRFSGTTKSHKTSSRSYW